LDGDSGRLLGPRAGLRGPELVDEAECGEDGRSSARVGVAGNGWALGSLISILVEGATFSLLVESWVCCSSICVDKGCVFEGRLCELASIV